MRQRRILLSCARTDSTFLLEAGSQSTYIQFVRIVSYVTVVIAAYMLGSIPTGYLVARAKGVDIRTVGSGNIGATNVFRILGKPAGIFVLVMDALKGWAACAYLSLFAYEHVAPNYFVENVRLIVSLKVV